MSGTLVNKRYLFWIITLGIGLLPLASRAQSCNVSVPTPVNFGNYNPTAALDNSTTGTLSVSCSGGLNLLVNYSISLSAGNSGTISNRKMLNGSYALNYNLYTDILHTQIWGSNTVSGSCLIVTPIIPCTSSRSVYGLLPAGQTNAAVGSYSDTITVTVSY